MGDFRSMSDVWFNKESITNILSFALIAHMHRITHDNDLDDAFKIHKNDGSIIKFSHCGDGSHHHNARTEAINFLNKATENSDMCS